MTALSFPHVPPKVLGEGKSSTYTPDIGMRTLVVQESPRLRQLWAHPNPEQIPNVDADSCSSPQVGFIQNRSQQNGKRTMRMLVTSQPDRQAELEGPRCTLLATLDASEAEERLYD